MAEEFYVKGSDVQEMLLLAIEAVLESDKMEAINKIDTLREFVGSEVHSSETLRTIMKKHQKRKPIPATERLTKTKNSMDNLYSVACHSDYGMDVLEACHTSKRGYDTAMELVRASQQKYSLDLVPYIKDTGWGDGWMHAFSEVFSDMRCANEYTNKALSLITPEHSSRSFELLCKKLGMYHGVQINIDWFKDPLWKPASVEAMLRLQTLYPDYNYGEFINAVHPIVAIWAATEVEVRTRKEYEIVLDEWRNVTPLLDMILLRYYHCKDVDTYRSEYNRLVAAHHADGDELANMWAEINMIHVPEEMNKFTERFKQVMAPKGAVDWLRKNGAPNLATLPDGEVWELGRDTYYKNHK